MFTSQVLLLSSSLCGWTGTTTSFVRQSNQFVKKLMVRIFPFQFEQKLPHKCSTHSAGLSMNPVSAVGLCEEPTLNDDDRLYVQRTLKGPLESNLRRRQRQTPLINWKQVCVSDRKYKVEPVSLSLSGSPGQCFGRGLHCRSWARSQSGNEPRHRRATLLLSEWAPAGRMHHGALNWVSTRTREQVSLSTELQSRLYDS